MQKIVSCSTSLARRRRLVALLVSSLAFAGLPDAAVAKRGGGAPGAPPPILDPVFPSAGPPLPVPDPPSKANGFSILGLLQSVSVDGGCPAAKMEAGGSATIDGVIVVIPTNTVVQFPAHTLKWSEVVCPPTGAPPIALDGTGGGGGPANAYPSVEMRIIGNIVAPGGGAPNDAAPPGADARHIAALVYVSQHSLQSGSGYISFIDYADGSLYVTSGAGAQTRLVINDPTERFGRQRVLPDPRFSVDAENPTIKSAGTGYPMCVPRQSPPGPGGAETDAACPQKNRPRFTATTRCRDFAAAGIRLPTGVELPQPATPGSFCSAFVMKAADDDALPGVKAARASNPANVAGANDPDPRQQAPLEVGDFITWRGTVVRGGNALAPAATRPTSTSDVVWAHTIDANVGIFTQPRTLPAYVAIGDFKVGVDPLPPTAREPATGDAETTDRLVLEAETSDVGSLLDVYFVDFNPTTGKPTHRWLTTEPMTNTLADQIAGNPSAMSAQPFGGGIQTQFTEAAPGRARIRVNKVPAIGPGTGLCTSAGGSVFCAHTQSPTRYIRAVLRTLCAPKKGDPQGTPATNPGNLDGGPFFDVDGARPPLSGASASDGSCLHSAIFANGLATGQYAAPTPEFIFAENVVPGTPIVPNNFWQMDFLVRGEGGGDGNATGPQSPRPW